MHRQLTRRRLLSYLRSEEQGIFRLDSSQMWTPCKANELYGICRKIIRLRWGRLSQSSQNKTPLPVLTWAKSMVTRQTLAMTRSWREGGRALWLVRLSLPGKCAISIPYFINRKALARSEKLSVVSRILNRAILTLRVASLTDRNHSHSHLRRNCQRTVGRPNSRSKSMCWT